MASLKRAFSVLCLLSFLAACAPAPTPTALPPTQPAIQLPTATLTPLPTPAPSPTTTPEPRYLGPLTADQQERLSTAALRYVADTPDASLLIARSLGYLGLNANPETMCGPLAVRILQDAGLADPAIDISDYYYLDPRPGMNTAEVENLFPDEYFPRIEQPESINLVDFSADPLYPGDFLYLFAGDSGSFEHMLVVSRVDDAGRAFAVTNLNIPGGTIIREVMLYDPASPGTGQFYEWTTRENYALGRTGYGGFWLWRRNQPLEEPDAALQQLRNEIDTLLAETGGEWHILIREVDGPTYYSRLPYAHIHPASVIKLADAVLFLKLLEDQGVTDLQGYLDANGTDSRTFAQLMSAMVVDSEESATTSIENTLALFEDPNAAIQALGYPHTFITPRQSTAAEMARMLESLYQGDLLSPQSSTYLLSLLEEITPSDDTRVGVIRPHLGGGDALYNKRGSLSDSLTIVADLALLFHHGKAYTLAFFAYPPAGTPVDSPQYEELEKTIETITLRFWEHLTLP